MVNHSGASSIPTPLQAARHSPLDCYNRNELLPSLSSLLGMHELPETRISKRYLTLLKVVFLYGCRISEVLSLTHADCLSGCRVILHGSKGSNSRLLYLPCLDEYLASLPTSEPEAYLFPLQYQSARRACVSLGIVHTRTGRHNQTATHSGRVYVAQNASNAQTPVVAGQLLGHRSLRSIYYYLT